MEWGGNAEGEVSLQATWDQGGRDRTTQKEGFQISKRGLRKKGELMKKNSKRESAKGVKGGLRHNLILLICVYVLYHCMNATNKRMCLGNK